MPNVQELLTRELWPELELLRPLGQGSTARVFLAREPALERLVTVKVLHPELAVDPVASARFEREAKSAARISHPNVQIIHRVGRLSNGAPYIVMEYLDGRTVREIVALHGAAAFGLAEARSLLAAVASALAAAHEGGIVHRDVRPDNVFVENRTGRAVLADFGIAARLETGSAAARLTATGVRLGEPAHMSPEQIRSEPVTAQSDVYGFGVLAYEVLAGRGPYEPGTAAQLLRAHLQEEPRRIRELREEVDPRLAGLIESCLAKDPARRPQSREIATALLRPPAVTALPPHGAVAQFLAELKRRKVYQVLVGYCAFALAVLGGAQSVFEAFDLPHWSYRMTVGTTLAGLPLAVMISWLYDLTATGFRLTRPAAEPAASGWGTLKWLGLGASIVVAAILGWVFLRTT